MATEVKTKKRTRRKKVPVIVPCEDIATYAVSNVPLAGFKFFPLCDKHSTIMAKAGWLGQPTAGDKEDQCVWAILLQEFPDAAKPIEVPLAVKKPRKKRARGRPPTYKVWRCDKRPNLRVLIPVWQGTEDVPHPLGAWPYAEFRGTRLDTKAYAEYRGLTLEQVKEMNEVVGKTKFVRLETQITGHDYTCGFCGHEAKDSVSLGRHWGFEHAEMLDVVPNRVAL